MNILFTPAGNTDPVRDYHDGGILHIIRHYPIDRVVIFLTKEMAEKEDEGGIYTKGVHSVKPDIPVELIKTDISNPQRLEELLPLSQAFYDAQAKYPDAKWYINVSSGTPQMKLVVSLLALDDPNTTAVQVESPARRSNLHNNPNEMPDMLDMLEVNQDAEEDAPNRCLEPPFRLLRRHGICLQIESLVNQYEYEGALTIAQANRDLFTDMTQHLLQHAVYRENLQWKLANKEIASYQGERLLPAPSDFSEYFLVMEMRQRKNQLPEFIVKLSPVLVNLGVKYMKSLATLDLAQCGSVSRRDDIFYLEPDKIRAYRPCLYDFLDGEYTRGFHRNPLTFDVISRICVYLRDEEGMQDVRHKKVTTLFSRLRTVESNARNLVAHTITNLTEQELQKQTASGASKGYTSRDIMQMLHDLVRLVYKRDFAWDYDRLNRCILDSLKEVNV